jgi:hypothetical protein
MQPRRLEQAPPPPRGRQPQRLRRAPPAPKGEARSAPPRREIVARLAAWRALPPEELERRLHHVEVAIKNLHAARLPDVARRLEMVARRIRDLRDRAERADAPSRRPQPPARAARQVIALPPTSFAPPPPGRPEAKAPHGRQCHHRGEAR